MRMKIPSRAAMKKTPKTGYQSVTKPRREAATTVSMRIVPEIIESPRFPSVESRTDRPTNLPDIRPFVRLFRTHRSPKLTLLRRRREGQHHRSREDRPATRPPAIARCPPHPGAR